MKKIAALFVIAFFVLLAGFACFAIDTGTPIIPERPINITKYDIYIRCFTKDSSGHLSPVAATVTLNGRGQKVTSLRGSVWYLGQPKGLSYRIDGEMLRYTILGRKEVIKRNATISNLNRAKTVIFYFNLAGSAGVDVHDMTADDRLNLGME